MFKEKKKISAYTPFSKGLRKGYAFLTTILILCLLMCFPVSAAQNSSNTYKLSISRPSTGSSTGYAEVLLKDSSGNPYVRVFSWNIYQVAISADSISDYITSIPMQIKVSSTSLEFKIVSLTGISGTFFADIHTMNNGQNYHYHRLTGTSDVYTFDGKIVSMHVYGNYMINNSSVLTNTEFYVLYSDNGPIYNAIVGGQQDQTDQIIQGQEEQTSEIIKGQEEQTSEIIKGQEEQTEDIKNNQDKNTQSIIDNQNQLQENEKTEANNTGDKGVSDVLEVIPTETDGLLTAFKKLTDTMTTTEITNCSLKIPTLKMPQIKPFFNEKVLLEEQEIDFHDYVVLIPEKILTLIQNLFTIALIVYCFKELYSTISYVMTLKGENANE